MSTRKPGADGKLIEEITDPITGSPVSVDGAPTRRVYLPDGQICFEEWEDDSHLPNREDGPARIEYRGESGDQNISYEWWRHGIRSPSPFGHNTLRKYATGDDKVRWSLEERSQDFDDNHEYMPSDHVPSRIIVSNEGVLLATAWNPHASGTNHLLERISVRQEQPFEIQSRIKSATGDIYDATTFDVEGNLLKFESYWSGGTENASIDFTSDPPILHNCTLINGRIRTARFAGTVHIEFLETQWEDACEKLKTPAVCEPVLALSEKLLSGELVI